MKVLEDNNSYTSFVTDKNSDFSLNQVIRILDQIGNDIAVLFNNRYLGKIQNNEAGRVSFWNDVVMNCCIHICMGTYTTTEHGLKKPDNDDFYNIQSFNENTTVIEAHLSDKENHVSSALDLQLI